MSIVCNPSKLARLHRKPGFTLVELLVVIVIIVVLAGVGFTTGRKILKSSRESTAISNLRQIGQGLGVIQTDGGVFADIKPSGTFPAEAGYTRKGVFYNWVHELAEMMGYGKQSSESWGSVFKWKVDPNDTIFRDPTADWELVDDSKSPNDRGNNTLWKTAQYGYNVRLATFVNPFQPTTYDGDKENFLNLVTDPSVLIMVAQSKGTGKLSAYESSLPGNTVNNGGSLYVDPWGKNTATRIRGGAHCLFVDGHIGWVNSKKLYQGSWNSPNFEPVSDAPRKNVN